MKKIPAMRRKLSSKFGQLMINKVNLVIKLSEKRINANTNNGPYLCLNACCNFIML